MVKTWLKIILKAILLIQGSVLFFAFLVGGVVEKFYDYLDIILEQAGFYYSVKNIVTALFWGTCFFIVTVLGRKKRKDKVFDWLTKKYEEIGVISLLFFNVAFGVLIYFGNLFLKDFSKYNNQIKQKSNTTTT